MDLYLLDFGNRNILIYPSYMVIGNLTKEGIRVMVFNATFNNISAISSCG